MRCCDCEKDMEEGYLSSRGPIFWSEDVTGLSLPTRPGDVLLGKMLGLARPRAWLCRTCRKIIVSY